MIDQIYDICNTSQNIKEDITLFFNENNWDYLDQRGFSSDVAYKLIDAFKDIKGAEIAFASTLKPGYGGVNCSAGYGQIYFTLPFAVQEEIMVDMAAKSLLAINQAMCFQYNYQMNSLSASSKMKENGEPLINAPRVKAS